MRTDLNELREIVMDEFSTDYGGGNIGLTPAGESLIALIDAELARPTSEDVDRAIIEASYQKLKIAVGYAESIENSDDYQDALDMMKDAALRAYKQPTDEDAESAIAHYEYRVQKRKEDIKIYRESHNQELIMAANTLENALRLD